MSNTIIAKGNVVNNPSLNTIGGAHFVRCTATGGTQTIEHRANGTIKSRSAAGGSNTATYQENTAWHSFSCNSFICCPV